MRVRLATRSDLLAIGRVADAAAWETYSGLLKPDTIARLLSIQYSPAAVRRRLLQGGIRVADAGSAGILGFADADVDSRQIRLGAISTEPAYRRTGVADALLASIRASHPGHPVYADVLLGNLDGERFYESQGFAPGEVIEGRLFDEEVVERRWWLAPPTRSTSV
jgi:GNAT superfamily N-acetyltransferase